MPIFRVSRPNIDLQPTSLVLITLEKSVNFLVKINLRSKIKLQQIGIQVRK